MSLNYRRGEIDGKKILFSVSVLIPLTDFKTIDETIESVVRQGCSKCEILILRNDIQSLPQGTDVAEKNVFYLDSNYLLREIFIRKKGKCDALNAGISRAKNDLICVLDADCISMLSIWQKDMSKQWNMH